MSRKPKYFMPDHYKQWTTTERESFIMSFYPKVEEIVESLGVPEKYYPDLISAGMLGVVETIEEFIQDSEDHYYLSQAIHNSIAISILQCYLTLATAFSIKVTRLGLQRTRDLIAGEHLEEIMHQLEVPPKYYNNFVMALNSYDSYQDSPSSEDIEESAINNVSITEIETTILELYAAGIMSEQELIIFINYYGLFGHKPLTLAKIVELDQVHCNVSYASASIKTNIHRLKKRLNNISPRNYSILRKSANF